MSRSSVAEDYKSIGFIILRFDHWHSHFWDHRICIQNGIGFCFQIIEQSLETRRAAFSNMSQSICLSWRNSPISPSSSYSSILGRILVMFVLQKYKADTCIAWRGRKGVDWFISLLLIIKFWKRDILGDWWLSKVFLIEAIFCRWLVCH